MDITALRELASLGEGLPLLWLDEEAARAALREQLQKLDLKADEVLAALFEGRRYRCVAKGPDVALERPRATQRGRGSDRCATFFWHDTETGRIALAMNAGTFPELWIFGEPTPAGMLATWRTLRGDGAPADKKIFRFFLRPMANLRAFMDLENELTLSPFTEGLPLRLGTAAAHQEEDDSVHYSIFQALYSKTRLSVAVVHGALGDDSAAYGIIEYTPSQASSVVETWNASNGTSWPLDAPVDVLPTLAGNLIWSVDRFDALLDSAEPRPEHVAVGVIVLDGPGPGAGGAAAVEPFLRKHSTSKSAEVRATVGSLACNYALTSLLESMIDREPEKDVRAYLRETLKQADENDQA